MLYSFYCSKAAAQFRRRTVLLLSDNQGVRSIIKKGSSRRAVAEMARKIFLACRRNKIVLITNWESCEAEIMVTADLGSYGPWFGPDDFQMDFDSHAFLLSK